MEHTRPRKSPPSDDLRIPANMLAFTDETAGAVLAHELHPMWKTQVQLERGMLRRGANKVRDRIIELERKGQMSQAPVIRGLITEWLPGIAQTIKGWIADIDRSRGPKPISLQYLKDVDPYVAALVTLRAILDGIATERRKLVALAMDIGRTIEHEQRVRLWEGSDDESTKALFYHYRQEHERNRATATHRRRVNVTKFNDMVEQGRLSWDAWSMEAHFRVGITLIDCVIRKTQWFELQEDPEHIYKAGRMNNRAQLVLAAKPGMMEWLGKALDHAELTSPEYKPTVIPPKRWTSTRQGGYWTPYVRAPRLVRFKASQETQRAGAADEYDALDMPLVYDAIHLLQETPWRVNKRVLEVALKAWALDQEIGKLPKVGEYELPPRTPRMMANAEANRKAREEGRPLPVRDTKTDQEILQWKREAGPIHRANAKRMSRMRSTTSTIQIAQEYADFEEIYFPHMLDFRGRIYPIANFLQPQGNDLARGLLTFAEGAELTIENNGAEWLAIQLASCFGYDKWTFDERIGFVQQSESDWRAIAADPMANRKWASADKPWQTLAAIFEWVDYLDHEGDAPFMSSLPVSVDGTCNGIQHLSAIMRDKVSGSYVNLLPTAPGERPRDIYKFVADKLQVILERIEKAGGPEGKKATYWLDITDRDLPRELTKRQVMVLPYSGTKDSFFTYTRKWLDATDPMPVKFKTPEAKQKAVDLRNARLSFLVLHLWDTVNDVVSGGMKVMRWLQDCAKVVAVDDQPIYWTTPSGFTVRHFYGQDRAVKAEIMLEGVRHVVTYSEKTAKLSVKEQVQGIAPNFIHSLDASCLVECLRLCRAAGITSFASVHDAFGTHAANMWPLADMLRQAFVTTHEADVLGAFRNASQSVLVSSLIVKRDLDPLEASQIADGMLPPVLEKGDLELADVLGADYFFS